jgi:peptidyl-prolyl cis-trans isomerase C
MSMHLGSLLRAAALALPLMLSPACQAQQGDEVVARVEGTEIRASDLALAEEDIGADLSALPPESKREYLITYLSDIILAAKAAESRRMGDGEAFKRKLAYVRSKLLMEALLQAETKSAITEEAQRQVYAEATRQLAREPEIRARQILVPTEEEAKEVVAELKKGADFGELARTRSKDSSAAEGGDLGYFTRDEMVPEFAEAAMALEKGQVSEPVKTPFGWHVIKLEDKRAREVPPFESVREQIVTYLQRKTQAEVLGRLRQGATIERLDQPGPPK